MINWGLLFSIHSIDLSLVLSTTVNQVKRKMITVGKRMMATSFREKFGKKETRQE